MGPGIHRTSTKLEEVCAEFIYFLSVAEFLRGYVNRIFFLFRYEQYLFWHCTIYTRFLGPHRL